MKTKRVIECGGVAKYVEPKPSHTPTPEYERYMMLESLKASTQFSTYEKAYIARCVNTHEAQVKMIRVAVKALTELAQNPNRIDVDLYAQGALDTMKDISEALSQAEGKGS